MPIIQYNYYYITIIATGFCDEETIVSESGTTFLWPESQVGERAMFVCPLDQLITISRSCGAGGVWGQFDETTCGSSISGQLNGLVDLFSNVRKNKLLR